MRVVRVTLGGVEVIRFGAEVGVIVRRVGGRRPDRSGREDGGAARRGGLLRRRRGRRAGEFRLQLGFQLVEVLQVERGRGGRGGAATFFTLLRSMPFSSRGRVSRPKASRLITVGHPTPISRTLPPTHVAAGYVRHHACV